MDGKIFLQKNYMNEVKVAKHELYIGRSGIVSIILFIALIVIGYFLFNENKSTSLDSVMAPANSFPTLKLNPNLKIK